MDPYMTCMISIVSIVSIVRIVCIYLNDMLRVSEVLVLIFV